MNKQMHTHTIKKSLLVLCLVLLSACSTLPNLIPDTPIPPELTEPPSAPTQEGVQSPEPIRLAEVNFRVTIPADTPSDGPIQLSILDEVTGLALNTTNHVMQAETENIYSVTVQLPADAVIKYRYTRGSTIPAAEHTSDGRPVRYRILHTRVSGAVHDIVTRWNDTAYTGPSGRIYGTITDSQTGAPIPDILVTAGGQQTVTRWDGSYLLTGLPPGTHNLVTYAKNAAYTIFQQGAVIAAESATPANFALDPLPLSRVTFLLAVPEGTIPGVPVRIAGNVYQLGNSFADLGGGISTPAARLPLMAFDPESGTYSLSMDLPAGAYIRYKYTLGDGFWNAETNPDGNVTLREFVVPASETVLDDRIANWASSGNYGAVWFAIKAPADTPQTDTLWLQLNPWGWTEPLPMWRTGTDTWVYLLSSPLNLVRNVDFRYCRNAQCDTTHDEDATGPRSFQPGEAFQPFEEALIRWISFTPYENGTAASPTTEVTPRGPGFLTGITVSDNYHPSWSAFAGEFFRNAADTGANTVFLTPTWTYSRDNPPVLEIVNGRDMTWLDVEAFAEQGDAYGIDIGLYPRPRYLANEADWWETAPRDYAWWVNWFEQYGYFLDHHTALASNIGAGTLVLGGNWLNPAIPNGFMPDGFTSGVPNDAEAWWSEMITSTRENYSGRLAWALTFPQGVQNPPPFIDQFDEIYIVWEYPLAKDAEAGLPDLLARAENGLDNLLLPFYLRYNKPIILELSFPAADGGTTGCDNGVGGACEPLGKRDLEEQLLAYEAVLRAVNGRDWIQGVVTAEYYPPVEVRDKSFSVHGKPAEELLKAWFTRWLVTP